MSTSSLNYTKYSFCIIKDIICTGKKQCLSQKFLNKIKIALYLKNSLKLAIKAISYKVLSLLASTNLVAKGFCKPRFNGGLLC